MNWLRRLRHRFWLQVRRVLSSLVEWAASGTAAEVTCIRIDNGTPHGKLYRHANIGRVETRLAGEAEFLVLVDFWGNEVAEYRHDLVISRRHVRNRVLGELKPMRVARA